MQIVNNRALVFHTDNAAQITALIPKSKVLDTEGNLDRVVVDWSLDAWRILRIFYACELLGGFPLHRCWPCTTASLGLDGQHIVP